MAEARAPVIANHVSLKSAADFEMVGVEVVTNHFVMDPLVIGLSVSNEFTEALTVDDGDRVGVANSKDSFRVTLSDKRYLETSGIEVIIDPCVVETTVLLDFPKFTDRDGLGVFLTDVFRVVIPDDRTSGLENVMNPCVVGPLGSSEFREDEWFPV